MLNESLLTTEQAAQFLNTPKRTLENWRVSGEGPRFARLTPRKIRYRPQDLAEWVEGTTVANTAQY